MPKTSPAPAPREEYLSPAQLSEEYGIPVSTVYGWRHRKYGPPAAKLGRHVRYRRSDVDAWFEGQKK